MEKIDRRTFFKQSGKDLLGGLAFINLPFLPKKRQPNLNPLYGFLQQIAPEEVQMKEILQNYPGNIMAGIKNLNTEDNLADLQMYYPLYRAAQIKYQIPALLLWIIHAHETTVSRDPNPEQSGHHGAMQLSSEHYNKELIIHAPDDWEFLDNLPQRYSTKLGWQTNDWEEILRAACLIRWMAGWGTTEDENGILILDPKKDEQLILEVAEYRYSNSEYGFKRVSKYLELKQLFQIVS